MRQRSWAALAVTLLIAVAPALAAAPAEAAAPVTAKLAIAVRPDPVLAHEAVTIVGSLRPVRTGRVVTLQVAVGTAWKSLASARTDARGDYSIRTRVLLTGTEAVRAVLVAADGTQVVSPTLTLAPVKPVVVLHAASWVQTGGVLRTTGGFAPSRPGRRVVLQRKAGDHWVTIASAQLDRHSHYAMNAPLDVPPGAAGVRVVATSFDGSPAASSPIAVVTVADVAPALVGPISQIYLGLARGSTPGSYAQPAHAPALDFTADGQVTSAVPVDGPDAGGTTLPTPVRIGVYQAHDGVVDIAWETDGTTVTLRPNSLGQLSWNGLLYGVVDPLQGVHLSGTYKRLAGGSGATITFHGSGRFLDEGITGDTNLVTTDNPSGAGSYNIRGNTIYLVYDSGPLESMAVYVLPQQLGPKAQIVLGGTGFRLLS